MATDAGLCDLCGIPMNEAPHLFCGPGVPRLERYCCCEAHKNGPDGTPTKAEKIGIFVEGVKTGVHFRHYRLDCGCNVIANVVVQPCQACRKVGKDG